MILPAQPGLWELSSPLASPKHFVLKWPFLLVSPWAVSSSDLALQFVRRKWEKISFCYEMNKLTLMCCMVLVRQGLQKRWWNRSSASGPSCKKFLADQNPPLFQNCHHALISGISWTSTGKNNVTSHGHMHTEQWKRQSLYVFLKSEFLA